MSKNNRKPTKSTPGSKSGSPRESTVDKTKIKPYSNKNSPDVSREVLFIDEKYNLNLASTPFTTPVVQAKNNKNKTLTSPKNPEQGKVPDSPGSSSSLSSSRSNSDLRKHRRLNSDDEGDSRENEAKKTADKIIKLINKGTFEASQSIKTLATAQNKNYQDDKGSTFLVHAIKKENLSVIEILLRLNPDLSLQNAKGNTALIEAVKGAAKSKNFAIIDKIINCPNVNLNISNKKGDTFLTLYLKYGFIQDAPIIAQKVDFNLPCGKSINLLQAVVESNNVTFVKEILKLQQRIENKEIQKTLALTKACQNENLDITTILIKYDCNIPAGIENTVNSESIKHLVHVARLVDASYQFIHDKDNKQVELVNLKIEKGDYNVFCFRLLQKIKYKGLEDFDSISAFWAAYKEKYDPIFMLPETEKVKFINYLSTEFRTEADFNDTIKRETESKTKNLDKVEKRVDQIIELNVLLGSILDDPYNPGGINKLNQALADQQEIGAIIKKYPEIEGKILKVHQMLLNNYGLMLVNLNKTAESLQEQKNIPLISKENVDFETPDYLIGRTLAGENGDSIVYIKCDFC